MKFLPRSTSASLVAAAVLIAVGGTALTAQASDAGSSARAQALEGVQQSVVNNYIDIDLATETHRSILRIAGPAGYALTIRNADARYITADLLLDAETPDHKVEELGEFGTGAKWETLPSGTYTYELTAYSANGQRFVKTGSFQVRNGQAMMPDESEGKVQSETDGDSVSSVSQPGWFGRLADSAIDLVIPSAHASETITEFVFLDDADADDNTRITFDNASLAGDQNVGLQYLNGNFHVARGTGPTFGDKIMSFNQLGKVGINTTAPQEILQVNDPDSTSASIRISNTANEYNLNTGSTTGFSIQEVGEATPFRIEPGAPSNVIRVNSTGNVGMGTDSPAQKLHLVSTSGSMRLRLDPTGSTWDLWNGGSGLWFQENDGGTTPFKLANTAPTDSLVVDFEGKVGSGTSTPEFPLHVVRSDGTAQVRVTDSGGSNGQTMFAIENSGHPRFRLRNSSLNSNWDFRTAGSGSNEQFQITNISGGTSSFLMRLFKSGDMEIEGTLTESSSVHGKTNIASLDSNNLLNAMSEVGIYEWSYKDAPGLRHIGPMAEDFFAAFGLGDSPETLAPRDLAGISFAASKLANERVEELTAQNELLLTRLAELETKVSSMNN